MLIDTHFHLDLIDDMQNLIKDLQNSDVGIYAVGTTPKAYERECQFCADVGNIHVGLGFHPQLIADRGHEIDLFLQLVRDTRYVGEIGLDFNTSYISSKNQQLSCFREIVAACADMGNKVLSIHSVKSAKTVIDELENVRAFQNNICIFHWFTGLISERKRAIEAGAWFSINPRMIKTKSGQETIKKVPADRILLETDAPFVANIQTAADLGRELFKLVDEISYIRGEDIRGQIEENSMKLFG